MFGFTKSKRSTRGARRRIARSHSKRHRKNVKKYGGLTGKKARKVKTARKRYKSGKGVW